MKGVTQPILLLEGFEAADLALISAQRLHTVVHSPEQLAALEQGTGRTGYRLDEAGYRYASSWRTAGTGRSVLSAAEPV